LHEADPPIKYSLTAANCRRCFNRLSFSKTSIHRDRVPTRLVKIQQSEKKFNSNEKKSESRNLSNVSYPDEQNVFWSGSGTGQGRAKKFHLS
jgi:hypothetical protein